MAIEFRLDASLPVILADASLLRQVLHNLVQNALDAMTGVDGAHMKIDTSVDGDHVRLAVEDNGAGVREGMLVRIFEPYVTTKPKGTGLGLAIVKKIVDEHGGTVVIANIKPRGARVEIALPIRAKRFTESERTT